MSPCRATISNSSGPDQRGIHVGAHLDPALAAQPERSRPSTPANTSSCRRPPSDVAARSVGSASIPSHICSRDCRSGHQLRIMSTFWRVAGMVVDHDRQSRVAVPTLSCSGRRARRRSARLYKGGMIITPSAAIYSASRAAVARPRRSIRAGATAKPARRPPVCTVRNLDDLPPLSGSRSRTRGAADGTAVDAFLDLEIARPPSAAFIDRSSHRK